MCCTYLNHICVSVLVAFFTDIYHSTWSKLLFMWPVREVIMRLCSYCWREEQIPTDKMRLPLMMCRVAAVFAQVICSTVQCCTCMYMWFNTCKCDGDVHDKNDLWPQVAVVSTVYICVAVYVTQHILRVCVDLLLVPSPQRIPYRYTEWDDCCHESCWGRPYPHSRNSDKTWSWHKD